MADKLVRVDDVVALLKQTSAHIQEKVGDMLFEPQMEALIASAFALDQAADAVTLLPDVVRAATVKVVRCKDCKHRGSGYVCPMRQLTHPTDGAGHYVDYTTDDGFCHRGEARCNRGGEE